MNTITCGFVGLGLIGGSIAKAIKAFHSDYQICAYDVNEESLVAAGNEGIVDIVLSDIGKGFEICDIIFLCAPVSCNAENLLRLKKYIKPDCLLTDVGSVKTGIHEQISALGLEAQFIGGHPMAGSERFGFANSKAQLLENAYYILTPTASVPDYMIENYKQLVQSLGAIPLILSYSQHDYVTGAISHLPHVIAAALVNFVRDADGEDGIMKLIAAGGFKDITRIASSSSTMWQQICLTNTDNISELLGQYIKALEDIKHKIDQKSEQPIFDFFSDARVYRDSFIEASSGPIKKSFSIYVDIPDEPGAIASIATMFALNSINIKNIGITHNREFEEGILRIEFYEEDSIRAAIELLEKKNYVVHQKK